MGQSDSAIPLRAGVKCTIAEPGKISLQSEPV
jgi:hypothetical protein